MTTQYTGLPVAGYIAQSEDNIALANEFKQAEERYLRLIDKLNAINIKRDAAGVPRSGQFDPRFMALARTAMQEANMWAVRSIFQPTRIALPEDTTTDKPA